MGLVVEVGSGTGGFGQREGAFVACAGGSSSGGGGPSLTSGWGVAQADLVRGRGRPLSVPVDLAEGEGVRRRHRGRGLVFFKKN
ncbi:hypothetical protein TIFTF001_006024 [Ficus carica]|uniref:Uncharacterized protein n=1 Tax=Ficus carica TaxID=3494 RepID=A0AA87ZLZ6_FICCA|nr:hypothetical protein TIFTF001_006024 [Ficus carica]